MADIFISYSSRDHEKADQLMELLSSAGLSVWIDRRGIEAASSWSEEIVDAIDNCHTFIVMLSQHSIASKNVAKEVSLASEKGKKILPLDLEAVEIPKSMQYALAGLQRAPMTNIDAVIRAIGKLGLKATQPPTIKLVKETDSRKSLMVLPFEDLSPTADNQWFADGIVSEMILSLSKIKALRLVDVHTTKEFKQYKGHLTEYAKEMGIRYFVQGDVRKFGDQIKISSRLLDINTGDSLWQDSLKGTMEDIFDIQEKVAASLIEGLNIYLSNEERSKLHERGTDDAEAYECYLRAMELQDLLTRDGFVQAIALLDTALSLDPSFAKAMLLKADTLNLLYNEYGGDPRLLDEAEQLLEDAETLMPGSWMAPSLLAIMYIFQGRREEAEREHQKHVARDDGSGQSLGELGYFCFLIKDYAKALEFYQASFRLDPSYICLWNIIVNAHKAGNQHAVILWADEGIAAFRRRLRLNPGEAFMRYRVAATYLWSGQKIESLNEIELLETCPELDSDSSIQFQVAGLLALLQEIDRSVALLTKAINKGHVITANILKEGSSFLPLIGHPEFESLVSDFREKQLG